MAVEAISHGGEITLRIFPKLKSMVSTGKTRFEIAQHGIDPAELRQILRFASTRDNYRMLPSRIGYSIEARETIGQDLTFFQRRARLFCYGGTNKSFNDSESRVDSMLLCINRDGCDKECLLLPNIINFKVHYSR